jgi:hypothetical protein
MYTYGVWRAALVAVLLGAATGGLITPAAAHGDFKKQFNQHFKRSFKELLQTRRVDDANVVSCNVNGSTWEMGERDAGSTSTAPCKDDEILVGGGCSFTCLAFGHTVSYQSGNSWVCRRLSFPHNEPFGKGDAAVAAALKTLGWDKDADEGPVKDGQKTPRTFQAFATCLKAK